MIHFSISMCRISVDIKGERRGRGNSIVWLMLAPQTYNPHGGGQGSNDSRLIVKNYIIVWFNF